MTVIDQRLRGAGKTHDLVADVLNPADPAVAESAHRVIVTCQKVEYVAREVIRQAEADIVGPVRWDRWRNEVQVGAGSRRVTVRLVGPGVPLDVLRGLGHFTPAWVDDAHMLEDGAYGVARAGVTVVWVTATPDVRTEPERARSAELEARDRAAAAARRARGLAAEDKRRGDAAIVRLMAAGEPVPFVDPEALGRALRLVAEGPQAVHHG